MVVERLFDHVYSAQLKDGLRILVEEDPQSRSVSVGAWVTTGSRDDPVSHPGLSHLIEHLAFKGTPARNGKEISHLIDSVGGHLNAATGRESTVYYADVPSEGFSTAVDVLADLACRPAFALKDIDLERKVVLDEIRGHKEDPEAAAFDHFVESVWEANHSLAQPVLGTADAIRLVPREAIVNYHQAAYVPSGMVVVACGNLKAEEAGDEIARRFGASNESPERSINRTVPGFRSGRVQFESSGSQAHIYLALPGAPADDADRYALEVLNVVLGDGTSSRLFRSIREDRGLAYAVGSTALRYTDVGMWMIYAGTAPEHAPVVGELLEGEIARLAEDGGVSTDELALAKARLRGMFVLSLESNANRAMRLGTATISGRQILSADEVLARLKAVSAADISHAIERFVQPEKLHQTIVAPED